MQQINGVLTGRTTLKREGRFIGKANEKVCIIQRCDVPRVWKVSQWEPFGTVERQVLSANLNINFYVCQGFNISVR